MPDQNNGWHAVLPFKGNGQSKQRLDLEQQQRNHWAQEWLQRALRCCQQCPTIKKVSLLTLGHQLSIPEGVHCHVQSVSGLNEGLTEWFELHRPRQLLVLLPDLPGLEAEDLQELLDQCPSPGLALAPDRHGQGSNALALSQVDPPPFFFGPSSCQRITQAAQERGLCVRHVNRPHLATDIDTLEDWKPFLCPSPSA